MFSNLINRCDSQVSPKQDYFEQKSFLKKLTIKNLSKCSVSSRPDSFGDNLYSSNSTQSDFKLNQPPQSIKPIQITYDYNYDDGGQQKIPPHKQNIDQFVQNYKHIFKFNNSLKKKILNIDQEKTSKQKSMPIYLSKQLEKRKEQVDKRKKKLNQPQDENSHNQLRMRTLGRTELNNYILFDGYPLCPYDKQTRNEPNFQKKILTDIFNILIEKCYSLKSQFLNQFNILDGFKASEQTQQSNLNQKLENVICYLQTICEIILEEYYKQIKLNQIKSVEIKQSPLFDIQTVQQVNINQEDKYFEENIELFLKIIDYFNFCFKIYVQFSKPRGINQTELYRINNQNVKSLIKLMNQCRIQISQLLEQLLVNEKIYEQIEQRKNKVSKYDEYLQEHKKEKKNQLSFFKKNIARFLAYSSAELSYINQSMPNQMLSSQQQLTQPYPHEFKKRNLRNIKKKDSDDHPINSGNNIFSLKNLIFESTSKSSMQQSQSLNSNQFYQKIQTREELKIKKPRKQITFLRGKTKSDTHFLDEFDSQSLQDLKQSQQLNQKLERQKKEEMKEQQQIEELQQQQYQNKQLSSVKKIQYNLKSLQVEIKLSKERQQQEGVKSSQRQALIKKYQYRVKSSDNLTRESKIQLNKEKQNKLLSLLVEKSINKNKSEELQIADNRKKITLERFINPMDVPEIKIALKIAKQLKQIHQTN